MDKNELVYGSVCSGIEAATVAFDTLGWEAAWYAEIESFPSKLLKHRFPNTPNLGDMTKLSQHEQYNRTTIDLLVGGTPCQSFSIAGLRGGLDSENGNLALEFCRILIAKQPGWFLWENVPGVFSSFSDEAAGKDNYHSDLEPGDIWDRDCTETADFATLLNAFRECGYSCAYRIFDSQYFGVPQRRRRVFVVGHLGDDWRPSAAVLFERESLRRNFTPSREKGKADAALTKSGVGTCGADDNQAQAGHLIAFGGNNTSGSIDVATACNSRGSNRYDFESETFIVFDTTQTTSAQNGSNPKPGDMCHTLAKGQHSPLLVHGTQDPCTSDNVAFALGRNGGQENVLCQPILYSIMPMNSGRDYKARCVEVSHPIMTSQGGGNQGGDYVFHPPYIVRRLTPMECERLQGFPDNWTNIPVASDTARYAAIGNSMTVDVMRWIGTRIDKVDRLLKKI